MGLRPDITPTCGSAIDVSGLDIAVSKLRVFFLIRPLNYVSNLKTEPHTNIGLVIDNFLFYPPYIYIEI